MDKLLKDDKNLFNYSWSDCYPAQTKSLENKLALSLVALSDFIVENANSLCIRNKAATVVLHSVSEHIQLFIGSDRY